MSGPRAAAVLFLVLSAVWVLSGISYGRHARFTCTEVPSTSGALTLVCEP